MGMAGTKRRLDRSDFKTVKKTKVDAQSQLQKPIRTTKPHKVRQSALPSPDDSSAAVSEDLEESPLSHAKAIERFASSKKILTSNGKTKTSKSTLGGQGVLNGNQPSSSDIEL